MEGKTDNSQKKEEHDSLKPARDAIATAMRAAQFAKATGTPLPKPLKWQREFYDATDERQLKLTGKVSSEADAKARLIAAIKNANHGATQISFTMLGYPAGASAQCFNLVGYGKMDGKYFVDQMEHSISPSSGYKTQVKASKVEKEDFA